MCGARKWRRSEVGHRLAAFVSRWSQNTIHNGENVFCPLCYLQISDFVSVLAIFLFCQFWQKLYTWWRTTWGQSNAKQTTTKHSDQILRRKKWSSSFSAFPGTVWGQHYVWICQWLSQYYTISKNINIEHLERLMTIEICGQSDAETWPDLRTSQKLQNCPILIVYKGRLYCWKYL